ncbi:S8 family peptidase [Clostridium sp. AM58-1XD]|uniref:S8 family peptidase n=1 Tax=Clostridium sp. AM58-1XD TaxID=2292307 RepID=UPI000E4945E4|nr:S8 family peptidase [Clostridium sp. AM58-1XD]RGY99913.1 peptidase [Clostridium sp. AM58-1XD]
MDRCTSSIESEDFADFIFQHTNYPAETIYSILQTNCVDFANREYAIAYVPLSQVLPLSLSKYSYSSIPKLYTPLDTTSMEASGITASFAQPSLSATGENVIIGIIDTGIQYENPLFRNSDGSTRILGIWDQTIPGDSPLPSPGTRDQSIMFTEPTLLYGTTYTNEEINQALASPSPLEVVPSTDTSGHGTFLAGIAAGGEAEDGSFIGASPKCNIGIVKLKPAKQYLRDFFLISSSAEAYQENDIMMGIKYLLFLASHYTMPLVILIGMGTTYGSHDGTAPLGQVFRPVSNFPGLVPVIAAGNESGYRHHFLGMISEDQEYEDVEISVASNEPGFVVELWSRQSELYTVGFISPTGEHIPRIPLTFSSDNRITFLLEQTVITVNYINAEFSSGSQLIFMRFEAPTPGIWHVRVYNSLYITGQFHMWLPIHGFLSENTVFLRSNPNTTITDPGNTPSVITVGAYNHENNSIYIRSSRGFTRTEFIKPELVAPGVNVYGPGLFRSASAPSSDELETTTLPMTRRSGTSVAAAHVAGAVADLLSWELRNGLTEFMSSASVKSTLIRGAERNPVYSYPSREWGYGKLDLYQSFLRMRE